MKILMIAKMKRLKYSMKQLSWKKGDLFDRVKNPKLELQRIQQLIDVKPFDVGLRELKL